MSTIFQVEKMNCNGCARHVAEAIKSIRADAEVKVDLTSGTVEVRQEFPDPAIVAKAITDAGYPARIAD